MIDFSGLNYWAILVAWLVNIGVGSFWYSPAGFGKLWHTLTGVDMMKLPKSEANRAIGYVIISSLLQAIALSTLVHTLGVTTLSEGLLVGLFVWFSFTAITTIGTTFYARRGWKFWWLNAGFFLVVMSINAVMFAVWR